MAPIFSNCNVCGTKLRTPGEFNIGMCGGCEYESSDDHPNAASQWKERAIRAEEENAKLRKILAFVPGRIAIEAKEKAGFGTPITTRGITDQ